ncbi:hypothetical protein MELA_02241 [Candidatus Methylomirabilis lanthanidiphila]|uniref:Uncharacterized protein n=1 Tax=Candidatus Methylomirabilis lanthanidiphila TaxID=2211376 RepID=A0A564ZKJ8_9BACT|nr:hypothetical protein [Candidatus Methylomirabilis lanthanidiphila]VUZ85855.1 hypothetical protein MELA_02241 [Candidatus Methylomirabilis lanthanidiphila]
MRQIVALGIAMLLIGYSSQSWAASESGRPHSTLRQVGTGLGSAIGTFVYFPFKATFCILGGLASGVTLVAAGSEQAGRVVDTACRGSWTITPANVAGEEPVYFVGNPHAQQ